MPQPGYAPLVVGFETTIGPNTALLIEVGHRATGSAVPLLDRVPDLLEVAGGSAKVAISGVAFRVTTTRNSNTTLLIANPPTC
jgi:hypothetical protein